MGYGDGIQPYKRPDGRWAAGVEVGYYENGKRRRRWVTAATRAEVVRKLRNLKREINSANQVATAAQASLTVKRWAEQWLPLKAQELRPKAYASIESNVMRWIIPTIGNRKLHELTPANIRRIDDTIKAAGHSTWTTIGVRRTLITMLKAAVAEGATVSPAIFAMPMPKRPVSEREAIPAPDMVRLLQTAITRQPVTPTPEPGSKAAKQARLYERMDPSRWLAALLYGQRQGESLGMTWEQIDLDRMTMTVDRQLQYVAPRARRAGVLDNDWYDAQHLEGHYYLVPVKSRAGERVQPMLPILAHMLQDWRERCPQLPYGLVWPRESGGPWSQRDDLTAWRGLQDAAGVHKGGSGTEDDPWEYYVLHEARHSVATLLMALQVPAPVMVSVMGHSSMASTQHYQHADLEQAQAALSGVAGLLQLEG